MSITLREEIKQNAAFESPEQETFLQILRTAGLLEHAMADQLKHHGLTLAQYNTLRILRGAGDDGLCRNEMVARMLRPVPDATRMLDRLVSAGFVVKSRDGADRRFVTARITDQGRAILAELDAPGRAMLEAQLGHLSGSQMRTLSDLLEAVRNKP